MSSSALVAGGAPIDAALLETVVVGGDLSKLTPAQRLEYYSRVCESVGLNPLTKPFAYLNLSGKLVLYATKDATEQIRKNNALSLTISAREVVEDVYVVTARAATPDGRTDEATGAVPIAGLKGEARANALMKAETKAKRRVTLSIAGLGWLDETETESIPGAQRVIVDQGTGEIIEQPYAAHPQSTAAPASGGAPQQHAAAEMKDARQRVVTLLTERFGNDGQAKKLAMAEFVGRDVPFAQLTWDELVMAESKLIFPEGDGSVAQTVDGTAEVVPDGSDGAGEEVDPL